MSSPALVLITDPSFEDDHIVRVTREAASALPPGAFAVQLRDKAPDAARRLRLGQRLREVTLAFGARLVVNGDAELADQVGADGVHLGHGSPGVAEVRARLSRACWVSVAAHTDLDVTRACADGADAVLVSPVGDSPGKGPARGLAAVSTARAIAAAARATLDVYALGGIDAALAARCLSVGASGVAVIRALLLAKDPGTVARSLVAPALRG